MTRQRRLIQDILNAKGHMTADEIFSDARRVMPSIALATVYRNLNQMAQEGCISRVRVADEPDRFDRTAFTHNHMVCVGCARVYDADTGDLKPLLEEKLRTKILRYSLDIRFLCPECARSRAADASNL